LGNGVNLWSTLRSGLLDSTNTGLFTGLLVFAVFLFWAVKWQGLAQIGLMGKSFLLGTIIAAPLVNVGFFDNVIFSKAFDAVMDWAHCIIDLLCLMIAAICLRDWWVFKNTEDYGKLIVRFPFLSASERPKRSRWIRFLLFGFSFICGGSLAFLQSVWPGDQQYFSILYYKILSPGGYSLMVICFLIVYGVCANVILILEFIALRTVLNSESAGNRMQRLLPKVQIVTAAVFFAYGATMIYLYYIHFYFANH
jgi:hypothetical protein